MITRRTMLKAGIGAALPALSLTRPAAVLAGPFPAELRSVPLDKKLSREWLDRLSERGTARVYRTRDEQRYVGMPIGGIGAGTVYLGGDGKLWCWDIFNQAHEGVVPSTLKPGKHTNLRGGRLRERDGANFLEPPTQADSPWRFEQGFALVIRRNGSEARFPLDHTGFSDIAFTGTAPTAHVRYRSGPDGIQVDLEAMTPFVPLEADHSSWPAVLLRYRIRNTGSESLEGRIEGWFENPALRYNAHRNDAPLENRVFRLEHGIGVLGQAVRDNQLPEEYQPPIEDLPDFGSFALACSDPQARAATHAFLQRDAMQRSGSEPYQSHPWSPAIAGLSSRFDLATGDSHDCDFVVAWYFPNLRLQARTWDSSQRAFAQAMARRWYVNRFANAEDAARSLTEDKLQLREATFRWRDAWYDSTLPHWILERCFNSVNALQTNTSIRFEDGRFWGWEGVGCCPGTCTHVWHYAQSVARLFPSLERDLRERTDYGIAFRTDGGVRSRAEFEDSVAIDGQAGVVLRTLREHQMSSDDGFLNRVWPKTRKAIEFLIATDARDGRVDGIPGGQQSNTLDASWYGKVPAFASLYVAALAAGERMAETVGDDDFARRCRAIADQGRRGIAALFRTEFGYFVQEGDSSRPGGIGIGDGCHIDQVIGQWWAFQLRLGRLFDGGMIRRALARIWDHNFCPDVGRYQASIKDPRHRGNPYALVGDAGVLTCTWPNGGPPETWKDNWQFAYFNTCFQGLEYQLAGHMIWESDAQPDLLEKGLAITRAVHDRYRPKARNPYNEIECSDHYSRAMSAYGIFLALCGYEIDGPRQHIGFKPRLAQDGNFKAAFTAPEGWGSFEQRRAGAALTVQLTVNHGTLKLRTMALRTRSNETAASVVTSMGHATVSSNGQDCLVRFDMPIRLSAGDALELRIQSSALVGASQTY